ncbi:MAG: cytidylate kinase-like family protein [Armatimonadota bacterium]|nr:cytidylate kinase-like family protein [bacterium]MDW8319817.1 cytidylate kinase-like family protein [Armatimonadota bacterium]
MVRISEDSRLVDQRVTESIVRLRSIEEIQRRERMRTVLPVVTISRQLGTNGSETAQKLVEMLGSPWQVWDQQIIDAIANHAEVRKEMVQSLDEHAQGELETVVKSLLGVQVIESPSYHKHLAEVLLTIERAGFAIILGRGANFLLPRALRVRLKASMPVRVERIMKQMNMTREQAERTIRESDKQRTAFIKQMFGQQIDEEGAYDLVIHTDSLSPEGVARIIHTAVLVKYPDLEKPSSPVYALVHKR